MNINDQWCVTALFRALLRVGGACKFPVCECVCVCVCQMVCCRLWRGDAGVLFHFLHTHIHNYSVLGEAFHYPSFPSGRFLIYLYLPPAQCLSLLPRSLSPSL